MEAIDDGLTVKQGKFAALVARGLNYSDAYAQVFKCKGMSQKTVNEKASRLAADGKVRARIRALLEEARVADVDDAAVAFNDLLRHLRKAEDAENWSYARKLVTGTSGGVFDLLDPVLERHSFDEFGELV